MAKWPWNKTVIIERPIMTEEEIEKALAAHVEGVPVFEAVICLIDEHMKNCRDEAIESVGNHGICASEVGGQQALNELRGEMLKIRQLGREND